jgi:predicted phage terminase large subunit-like protein
MTREPHPDDWRPHAGPQTRFLSLTCREAFYGGAAGGGKSASICVDAIRYVGRGYGRAYKAILFRRTFPELETSLIQESWGLYPRLGGVYNEQKKTWYFPGGEQVIFRHLEHETSITQHLGAAYQYIGFDELTTFTRAQYMFLMSRLRIMRGVRVPLRIRGASNPGSEGHDWVFARWAPWLDPKCPTQAAPGEILYFLQDDEGVERVVPRGTFRIDPQNGDRIDAVSRTFIPAKLEDNPSLYADGNYAAQLNLLDPVQRRRMRDGDWLIKPDAGLYFRGSWFRFVDLAPVECRRIRFWDRAATEKNGSNDPDWTVGVRLAITPERRIFIEDVVRGQWGPGDVERTILSTAELDGRGVMVALSKDPGAAGKFEADYYVRALQGFNVRTYPETADKVSRAGPISAQAHAGNISIVRGPWNEPFVKVLEAFPKGRHDDDVDALSGAYAVLTETPAPPKLDAFLAFRAHAPKARF